MDVAGFLAGLVASYGLVGLFFASVLANATLFLVAPIEVLVVAAAASGLYPPYLIGLAVGLGAGFGEMVGYLVGRGGVEAIKRVHVDSTKRLEQIEGALQKNKDKGTLLIFLAAVIPFPFDLVGLAAGAVGFPAHRFFIATVLGKTIRETLIAYAAVFGLTIIKSFFGLA